MWHSSQSPQKLRVWFRSEGLIALTARAIDCSRGSLTGLIEFASASEWSRKRRRLGSQLWQTFFQTASTALQVSLAQTSSLVPPLQIVKTAPVLAGVCATDPFRRMDKFLERLQGMGFAGVQNFPTVGLIDGTFRQNLEETGMGFGSARAARDPFLV